MLRKSCRHVVWGYSLRKDFLSEHILSNVLSFLPTCVGKLNLSRGMGNKLRSLPNLVAAQQRDFLFTLSA